MYLKVPCGVLDHSNTMEQRFYCPHTQGPMHGQPWFQAILLIDSGSNTATDNKDSEEDG